MDTKDKILNPHDKLFKEFFSKEKDAREFLYHYLPNNIKNIIDLTTLSISKDSFIEKELHEYFSDILYKVEIKDQPAWVYLLFEHKSYPDTFVAFQLLKYMVKIWELLLNQKQIHKALPVIIPLVIYHGKEKWRADTNLSHLFSPQDTALSSYIPNFDYILHDVSHLSDDKMKGAVTLRVFLLLLKYIFHDEFREQLFRMTDLFKELASKATGMEYLETFLRYIISATDKITEQDIKNLIINTLPQGGDTIMPTLAEKWIEQGIQQGMEKGILQGLLEAIQLGLELKFGPKGLALYADISKIDDIAQLRSIKEAIVIAKHIEDIQGLINR